MHKPVDVLVFPINSDNRAVADAKQYNACAISIKALQQQLDDDAESFGNGWKALLESRIAQAKATMRYLEHKHNLKGE